MCILYGQTLSFHLHEPTLLPLNFLSELCLQDLKSDCTRRRQKRRDKRKMQERLVNRHWTNIRLNAKQKLMTSITRSPLSAERNQVNDEVCFLAGSDYSEEKPLYKHSKKQRGICTAAANI